MANIKINGITDLRNDLIKVYEGARKRKLPLEEVKQFANVAGKIIGTAKTQIEYNALMKQKKSIPFLES